MKSSTLFTFGLLLLTNSVVASEQDKQQLRRQLDSLLNYHASFTQRVIDVNNQLIQASEGSIWLVKPAKFRWQYNDEDAAIIVADGENVYNIDGFVEQVSIFSQSEITMNNPFMLMISDDPSIWQDIDVTYKAPAYKIESKSPDAALRVLTLMFGDEGLLELHSVDNQGQKNHLIFDDIVINQPVDANLFKVDIPDDYVIDDQRTKP